MARAGADQAAGSLVLLRATAEEAAGGSRIVAGLTVVERAIRQLARQGHRVIIASDGTIPLPEQLPAQVEVRFVPHQAAADALCARLGWPPLVRADVVRPSNRIIADIRVEDEASRDNAEDAIFAELLRSDLGLVARYVNKPLSFRITRYLLCRLPVTPNQVTVFAGVVGLLGCALLVTGRPGWMFAGLLLAHVQSVLDGCDGELARVRFQQSAIGEWLDTLVDDGLNFTLVATLGIGLARLRGSPWPAVIGLATAAMLLTYNAVTYTELVRQGDGGEVLKVRWWFSQGKDMRRVYGAGSSSPLGSLMAFGRRDFFLLAWVLLAALGLWGIIQLYGVAIALPSFIGAVGQLVWRRRTST